MTIKRVAMSSETLYTEPLKVLFLIKKKELCIFTRGVEVYNMEMYC